MSEYIVYMHTNKANGLKYVGITQQKAGVRWQNGNGYRKQEHFWRAINKYGWDGFDHQIIAEGLTKEEACALEKRLIETYQTTDNTHGYNKSTGGESGSAGVEKNAAQRRAASKALKAKWENEDFRRSRTEAAKRYFNTPEAIKKRAEARKGTHPSEETRAKMSANRKGRKTGPFTEEHKRKIKEHHAGGAESRPVKCLDTGITYASINDAARATGIHKKQISGCCRCVDHYNTAGGMRWAFEVM